MHTRLVGLLGLAVCAAGCRTICSPGETRGPGYTKPIAESVVCVRIGERTEYATSYVSGSASGAAYTSDGRLILMEGTQSGTVSRPIGKVVPRKILDGFAENQAFKGVTDDKKKKWDILLTSEGKEEIDVFWPIFFYVQSLDLWLHSLILPTIPLKSEYCYTIKAMGPDGKLLRNYEVMSESKGLWPGVPAFLIARDGGMSWPAPAEAQCHILLWRDLCQDATYAGIVLHFTQGKKGLPVGEVAKGTPAEKAGLKARDIIVEVDGEVTRQLSQLVVLKSRKKPGDTIKLRIKRGRAIKEVDVVLDKWEKSLVGL